MSTETDRAAARDAEQRRPWRCTVAAAVYCPIHGDCTCVDLRTAPKCPLHAPGTAHPAPQR